MTVQVLLGMGVPGLLSTCLERREECVQYVDLVEQACQSNGIQILVDFYSFEHLILESFWKSLAQVHNNPYLRILGGEYRALDEYLTKLITDLQSLNIHLVMFVDGSKGSSKVGTAAKMDTWRQRHFKDLEKLGVLLDVCEGRRQMCDVSDHTSVRPVCLEVQIFETLQQCKCEVVQLVEGEADYVLARNLACRPEAFAVLSNDSDFCVFKDCRFIPNELFDLHGDLGLGQPSPLPQKPARLMAGVVSSSKVVDLLQLKEHADLVEVSILAGNDFTGPHLRHLKPRLGLRGHYNLMKVVQWVQHEGRVDNNPIVRQEMDCNERLAEAVQRSRQFYNLALPVEEGQEGVGATGLGAHLASGVEQGHFPGTVVAMHRNFYWHRMLLQDMGSGVPCAEVALAPLRSQLYRMMLDRRNNVVVEHGQTPYSQLETTMVYASQARLPTVNFVDKDKIFQNLGTFRRVMTHLEPESTAEWHKRYGWRTGFTCYMLRYFLLLNTGGHLYVGQSEFWCMLALVFSQVDEAWYRGLPLRPTTRCITLLNWLQDVYRHAYQFLGKLLYLTHEFPEPKSLFSGAVWAAFYMLTNHEGSVRSSLNPQCVQKIHHDMDYIIKEKRYLIRYIVDGVFPVDTRF